MITIDSEYLRNNWKTLAKDSIAIITLYEWDEGDAYLLTSFARIPSSKTINAAIVIEDKAVTEYSIVIRIKRVSKNSKDSNYQSIDGEQYQITAEQTIDNEARNIPINVVNVAESLYSRHRGLLETDLLKDSKVLIVGLGTGGIQVALELAKSGVGNFYLVDPDRLKVENVVRHHAGISFVGRKKVAVAKDLILEKNPAAYIETHPLCADENSTSLLLPIIAKVDLVICATDNRQSKLFVNSLCVKTKRTVIFGGAFRRAYGGQILRVYPHESACYHCFVLAMPDEEADREISSEENANEIAYSDMPVAVEPGLSIDVAPIATMISKLALQELIKKKESTLHILDKDFTASWYLWINRTELNTKYAGLPPLSDSIDEMTILRWYGVYVNKDSECPTCGDFEQALRKEYRLEPETLKDVIPTATFPIETKDKKKEKQ